MKKIFALATASTAIALATPAVASGDIPMTTSAVYDDSNSHYLCLLYTSDAADE